MYEVINKVTGENVGVFTMLEALRTYDNLGGCANGWAVVQEGIKPAK